jgi:hypothetical protein
VDYSFDKTFINTEFSEAFQDTLHIKKKLEDNKLIHQKT